MSIKLVAVDIDGTLLNNQKEITPEVFSAVQDAKAAGVKIVIATGRPIAGVQKLLEELELNQPDTMSLPSTADWCRILLQVKN